MPSQDSQVITASQAVVRASQEMLIKLYQRRNTDAPVSPALCEHFIRSADDCYHAYKAADLLDITLLRCR